MTSCVIPSIAVTRPASSRSGVACVARQRRAPLRPMISNSSVADSPLKTRRVSARNVSLLLGYDQRVDEVIANLIQRVGLDHPEAGRIHFEERALFGDQLDALGFRFEDGAPTRLACRQLAIGVLELLRPVVRVLRGGCGNGSGGGLLVVQLVWHRALHAHTRRSRHRWQGDDGHRGIHELSLGRAALSRTSLTEQGIQAVAHAPAGRASRTWVPRLDHQAILGMRIRSTTSDRTAGATAAAAGSGRRPVAKPR